MPSAWNRVTRPLREIRWRMARWSPSSDRQFHDDLFAPQQHDPFSPSYPGHLTIRRFADLALARLEDARSVLDLGCGPAEITCEMARRRPDVRFTGVDHSSVALDRARANADRLGLSNLTFESADLERFTPNATVDLIAMFDAFHHLLDPAAFLRRVQPFCRRLFLIEPAGRWTGQWDRTHDLDWLPATIFQMADRLEYEFGLESASVPLPAPATSSTGAAEPTEHRYTMEDFERLFAGYGLSVRGTIAGLEQYGARPGARSALRDRMAEAGYQMVVAAEEALYSEGLDLAAKHWAIHAVLGAPGDQPRERPRLPPNQPPRAMLPAYGVKYDHWSGPTDVRSGERFQLDLRLTNTGWRPWSSAEASPVLASYHWLDAAGHTLVSDGLRSPIPAVVVPHGSVEMALAVEAPAVRGRATLAVDLVHEGVTWFSDQGVPPLRIPFTITG